MSMVVITPQSVKNTSCPTNHKHTFGFFFCLFGVFVCLFTVFGSYYWPYPNAQAQTKLHVVRQRPK